MSGFPTKTGPVWVKNFRLGKRFQVRIILWRHTYGRSPDRLVLQPSFIYDCKRKANG